MQAEMRVHEHTEQSNWTDALVALWSMHWWIQEGLSRHTIHACRTSVHGSEFGFRRRGEAVKREEGKDGILASSLSKLEATRSGSAKSQVS